MITYFDLLAPFYDRLMDWFLGEPDPNLWKELLRLPSGGSLLDAGGGTGRVSAPLRSSVGRLVVADVSFGMLRQGRRKTGIDPVRADAARLPFADGSFERIMVTDALHHFPLQKGAIDELLRVLQPGGWMVIEEFDVRRFPIKVLALLEKLILMGSRFPTPEMICEMIRSSGLEPEMRKGKFFSVYVIVKG